MVVWYKILCWYEHREPSYPRTPHHNKYFCFYITEDDYSCMVWFLSWSILFHFISNILFYFISVALLGTGMLWCCDVWLSLWPPRVPGVHSQANPASPGVNGVQRCWMYPCLHNQNNHKSRSLDETDSINIRQVPASGFACLCTLTSTRCRCTIHLPLFLCTHI